MKITPRTRLLLGVLALQAALLATLESGKLLRRAHEADLTSGRQASATRAQKPPATLSAAPVRRDTFTVLKKLSFESQESLKIWEEKIFKNKTLYNVMQHAGQNFLKSSSEDAASGLYTRINVKVTPDLFLSWRWRAVDFPEKKQPGQLSNRRQDDFAARIYVIFPGPSFFKTNVIEYIWDESIAAGTAASSPFSGRVKLFVLRTGKPSAAEDGWHLEERNIYKDYVDLFGQAPKRPIGALAIMSDSDNTGTRSGSDFADIILKTRPPVAGERGTPPEDTQKNKKKDFS